jgi:nitroimidazol reductase NimA-like FMN-containing flavoprotein (pyridoxamine 5'-phosphate oxidase superfamily)
VRSRLTRSEHAYLAESRVCRIASVGRDGWVHAAPLSHAYDVRRHTLYVATDPGGRTARNLRARPRAAVACDDPYEDWRRIRGLVVRARAHTVRPGSELEHARSLLKEKFRQYRTYDLDYVIALGVVQVTSWGL